MHFISTILVITVAIYSLDHIDARFVLCVILLCSINHSIMITFTCYNNNLLTCYNIPDCFQFLSSTSRHSSLDSSDICQIFDQIGAESTECDVEEQRFHSTCQRFYCPRDVDESCVNLRDQKLVKCRPGLECCFEDANHQFCHGCIGNKCSNRTCGRDSSLNTFKRAPRAKMLPNALQSEVAPQQKLQFRNIPKPFTILYSLERISNSVESEGRPFYAYN